MKTFSAGEDAGGGGDPDSREWVFGVLGSSRHRQRMQQLEQLDLRRRPGCEPCLRSLVVGEWTPETLFHVGWCDSCGAAATALGLAAASGAGAPWYRRRATWLAVAALAVVAVPLAGSQVTGSDQGSTATGRGGVASEVGTAGAPATPATTGAPGTSGSSGRPGAGVTPIARSKSSQAALHERAARAGQRDRKALPLTT
jgi:hypothetical protein